MQAQDGRSKENVRLSGTNDGHNRKVERWMDAWDGGCGCVDVGMWRSKRREVKSSQFWHPR